MSFKKVTTEFRVSKLSATRKVAQAMVHVAGPMPVLAAGPAAVSTTVKAVAVTRERTLCALRVDSVEGKMQLTLDGPCKSPEDATPVTVSAGTKPAALSGYVAAHAGRDKKALHISCMGAAATYAAVKAVSLAAGYNAALSYTIMPFFSTFVQDGKDDATVMNLYVVAEARDA